MSDTYMLSVSVSLLIGPPVWALCCITWQTCGPTFVSDYIYYPNGGSGPAQAALPPPTRNKQLYTQIGHVCLHRIGAETICASVNKDACTLCLECVWDVSECVYFVCEPWTPMPEASLAPWRGSVPQKKEHLKLLSIQKNLWENVLLFFQGCAYPRNLTLSYINPKLGLQSGEKNTGSRRVTAHGCQLHRFDTIRRAAAGRHRDRHRSPTDRQPLWHILYLEKMISWSLTVKDQCLYPEFKQCSCSQTDFDTWNGFTHPPPGHHGLQRWRESYL